MNEVVEILMKRDGMSKTEACEFVREILEKQSNL